VNFEMLLEFGGKGL